MRASALPAALIALLAMAFLAPASSPDPAALNRAAALYHQDDFAASRAGLDSLLAEPGWRRRDSLMLFQYLGMAASRLGEDAEAASRFASLLALDSLFQFPRNEHPAVLRNFQAAREARSRTVAAPAPALDAVAPAAEPPSHERATLADAPADPLRALSAGAAPPRKSMSLALGAVPLGGGWLARERTGHALTLGLLQGGGVLLSLYASQQQTRARNDRWGIEEGREADRIVRWQMVQAVSLTTAVGAYLFSIFASGGG